MCLLFDAIVVFSRNPLKLNESGFMWDKMGHIVTNWHVIQNASNFSFVHFFLFISLFINSLSFFGLLFIMLLL